MDTQGKCYYSCTFWKWTHKESATIAVLSGNGHTRKVLLQLLNKTADRKNPSALTAQRVNLQTPEVGGVKIGVPFY